jgi:hypothetical protein
MLNRDDDMFTNRAGAIAIPMFTTARGIARLLGRSLDEVKATYGLDASKDVFVRVDKYPEVEAALVERAIRNRERRRTKRLIDRKRPVSPRVTTGVVH